MKLQILRLAILILFGVMLAACTAPPRPTLTVPASASPFVTPTRFSSPLATATSSELARLPTATHFVSPLATPTAAPSPAVTPTPVDTPTPLPTALIVPVTPTRLQASPTGTGASALPSPPAVLAPTATRAPVLPSPTFIPGPTSTRAPMPTPVPTVAPVLVTAWVSNPDPQPGVDVTVYGRLLVNGQPVANQGMVAHWHLKGRYVDCVADTGADGVAACSVNTYGLPAGFTVGIEIFIGRNEAPYRATTQLTIDD
jgi:hypothetical protein